MPDDFVDFVQDPNLEYGAGEGVLPDGRKVPIYDRGLADRMMQRRASIMVPVQNPSKELQTGAQQFLTSSGGRLGATQEMPNGQVMTVETHKPDFSRGQTVDHPGVTVREPMEIGVGPAEIENTPPGKISPEENKALDGLIAKYPNLTKEGLLKMFQHEGGYSAEKGFNPGAINTTPYTDSKGVYHPEGTRAAGIFQAMPSTQNALGVGDITKLSAADQLSSAYPEYLRQKGASSNISDADLGVLQIAPAFLGKPDDTIVYPKGSTEANANKGVAGPDGNVTVGSIKNYYGGAGGESGASASTPGLPNVMGPNAKYTQDVKNIQRTESGTPYTPEERQALLSRGDQNAQMLKDAYAPVIKAQADLQDYQLTRQQLLNKQIDKAQAQEDASRQVYQDSMDRVKEATDAVLADKQPPPFNGNTLAGVLAVVGQAMGAYGAILGKSQNWAANIVDGLLKRDADRWAAMHLDKKFKVQEEKSLATDQWHQFQSDKNEREMQQRLLIDNELQQQMGMSKQADTQRSLGLLLADNQNKITELDQNLQRLARGKVTNETVTENKQVSAPAIDEKTYQAYVKGDPTKGLPGRAELDTVSRDLQSLGPVLGLNYNKEDNSFKAQPGSHDMIARMPFTGQALGPAGLALDYAFGGTADANYGGTGPAGSGKVWDEKTQEARKEAFTRANTVINSAIYLASGKAINPEELKRKTEEFMGLSREDQIKALNKLMAEVDQKKADLEATYPGMESTFDNRRRAVSTPSTPITFTPGPPQPGVSP